MKTDLVLCLAIATCMFAAGLAADTLIIKQPADWAKLSPDTREVSVEQPKFTVDDIKKLAACTRLTNLSVGQFWYSDPTSVYVGDDHLAEICKFSSVTNLHVVYGPATTDAGLQKLALLANLEYLGVTAGVTTAPKSKWLAAFKDHSLFKLILANSLPPDDSFPEELGRLSKLQALSWTAFKSGEALKCPGRKNWEKIERHASADPP